VWAAQAYLRAAAHLGIWMKRKGFSVVKLDEQVIGEFARHLPSCRCLGKNRGIYDDAVIPQTSSSLHSEANSYVPDNHSHGLASVASVWVQST
jgi:hypothetical protein